MMFAKLTAKTLLRCRQPTIQRMLPSLAVRSMTLVPEARTGDGDLVKAAIHKMMMQQEQPSHHSVGVTPEDLQKASFYLKVSRQRVTIRTLHDSFNLVSHGMILQHKLDEVKACLADVEEEEDRETELQTTDLALEQAAAAYVDLLDLVREADEFTAVQFKEVREASAIQIRELRNELDQYRQEG